MRRFGPQSSSTHVYSALAVVGFWIYRVSNTTERRALDRNLDLSRAQSIEQRVVPRVEPRVIDPKTKPTEKERREKLRSSAGTL
jgi:hypothetical protein